MNREGVQESTRVKPAEPLRAGALSTRARPFVLWFGAALFLSAALVFSVQPMIGKMVLPRLGGAPAVWNGCMLFFQCALLGGYAYAHALTRGVALRHQVVLHTFLLAVAALMLPVSVPDTWTPDPDRSPLGWLLGLMTVRFGVPLLLLCASAPLLQHWFSRTGTAAARDPYFLYAASNAGSLLALLVYPLVLEPAWTLSEQSLLWTGGYALLVASVASAGGCVLSLPGADHSFASAPPVGRAETTPVDWRQRGWWVILAFVPSSLLLGVTTYISTDVAPVPMLWILPLVAYLLSFVLAFGSQSTRAQELAFRAMPLLLLPVVLILVTGTAWPVPIAIPVHASLFFVAALSLHGELARRRPDASHLTEFYLWVATGGALGGIFNALIAPLSFEGIFEYPLMLALACFLRRSPRGETASLRPREIVTPLAIGAVAAAVVSFIPALEQVAGPLHMAALGALLIWVFSLSRRPMTFGLAVLLFLGASAFHSTATDTVFTHRSYYGVLRVERDPQTNRHELYHGSTLHGAQNLGAPESAEPLAYYHRAGPIGQVVRAMGARLSGAHISVVGLGTGAMAAYADRGQRWTFFELDPAVDRVARDPRLFTYLERCGASCTTVLGDARLSLDRTRGTYDLLVLDAFSSDAIPVHLLTREALQLYLDRLAPRGVLAFHISNRHFDLGPLLGALAGEQQLAVLRRQDRGAPRETGRESSDWLVMARSQSDFGPLAEDSRWTPPGPFGGRPWTDSYSNVLPALKF